MRPTRNLKTTRPSEKTTVSPRTVARVERTHPVLHLQREIGNRATTQVLSGVLDQRVSTEFSRRLAKGGSGKKGFLRTPTYRKVKSGLLEYVTKRGQKAAMWRQTRVLKLEALVAGWLSKKKHLKDNSKMGVAHHEAMLWLQPMLGLELEALKGKKAPTTEDDKDLEEGEDSTGGIYGDSAFEEDDNSLEAKDEDDDSSSESVTVKDEDESSSESVTAKDEDSSSESVTVKDEDDDSSSESDSAKEDDEDGEYDTTKEEEELSLSTKDEAIEYLQPTPSELRLEESERNLVIRARFEEIKQLPNSESLISPQLMDHVPDPGKYGKLRQRGKDYAKEFDANSPALKEVYLAFQNAPPREEKTEAAAPRYMRRAAGWSQDLFDKYWQKMVEKWGDPNYYTEPEKEDDDKDDDSSSSSSSSSSSTSLSSSSSSSKSTDDEDPITVTKLSWKDRPEYQLHLGGAVTCGSSGEPYDTSKMFSVGEKDGFGIYVMSKNGLFYGGSHNVGIFHHSSFLVGADVAGAGEMKVKSGKIEFLTNKSGHYRPTAEQTRQVLEELQAQGVDLKSFQYKHYGEDGSTMTYSSGQEFLDDGPGAEDKKGK